MDDADVARALSGSRIPRQQKVSMLETALKSEVSAEAMNLVLLLEQRNKLHIAPALQLAYQAMLDDHRGVAHATVTTAVALTDDERTAIARQLSTMTGKQVDITPVVDESIIGGVVARIGDQLIDGSTKTKLTALKRRLEGAPR
jgi:F-type H+-transporting ATPase subunit delta